MKTLVIAILLGTTSLVSTAAVEDDLSTNARVRTALRADLGADARFIKVESYGGTVRLSGSVDSPSTSDDAFRAATDVDGVNHVMNILVPKDAPALGVD